MEKRQSRLQSRALEVRGFLQRLPNPSPALREALRRFEALVARMGREVINQGVAQMMLPVDGREIRALRRSLRDDHLFPVSRLARKLLKHAPNVEAALNVPHARANSEELAGAAVAVARALKPHIRLLITDGHLPKTFLADLQAAGKKLRDRSRQTDSAMRRRTLATEALSRAFSEISEEVAILDGLLRSSLRRDSTLAMLWAGAKRIPRQRGRPRKTKSAPEGFAS